MDISVPGTGTDDQPEPEVPLVSGAMSGTEIVIGLEDEQGEQRPVEIDEADEQLATGGQGQFKVICQGH